MHIAIKFIMYMNKYPSRCTIMIITMVVNHVYYCHDILAYRHNRILIKHTKDRVTVFTKYSLYMNHNTIYVL